MRKIFLYMVLFLGAIVGIILIARFSGSEDGWICDGGKWVKHGAPYAPMPISGCGSGQNDQISQDNFDEAGHLVKDNPGLEPGVWYLSFEKIGASALLAQLVFDSDSVCFFNGEKGLCPDVLLLSSSMTRVKGKILESGVVKVTSAVSAEKAEVSEKNEQEIKLYYYNLKKDKELSGGDNVSCSADAVLPVSRKMGDVVDIGGVIKFLIQGNLTDEEKAAGFTTEFPNKKFKLLGYDLKNGKLTLKFSEVPGFTDGGSCRVGILWAQIKKTAMQFPGVKSVVFFPDTLFQP